MGIILIVDSSVRAVDVYFLELARLFVCVADLEDVCPVVIYSSIGTVRLLGKTEVIFADFVLGGLITHIFLIIYIDLVLSFKDPDSLIATQTAFTLGVLATFIPLLMHHQARLFVFRRVAYEVFKDEFRDKLGCLDILALDEIFHPALNNMLHLAQRLSLLFMIVFPSQIDAEILLKLMVRVLFYLLQFDLIEFLHGSQLI